MFIDLKCQRSKICRLKTDSVDTQRKRGSNTSPKLNDTLNTQVDQRKEKE